MPRPLSRLLIATTLVGACAVPASAWSASTTQFGGVTGANPTGIALDASGNVYTSNSGSNSVTRISADGLTTAQFGGATGVSPTGIAIDSAGNVFTSNSGGLAQNTVTRISADGLVTTSPFGLTPGGLSNNTGDSPLGIATDATGNVFTANSGDFNASKVTPAGVIVTPFGPGAPYANDPRAIAVDRAGNVFLAGYGNNRVTRISADGLTTTAPFGGTTGSSPRAITVDSAGNVYTANGDNTVTRISASGSTTAQFGGPTGDSPRGIAIDPDGNVYTADSGTRTVTRISADGSTTGQYGGTTGASPRSIAIDADGNVFTANYGDSTVTRISPNRGPLLYAPTAFPTATAGVASTLTVTVTNSSREGSVRPTAITAAGAGVAVTGGTCAVGARIPALGTCTVVLSWTPTSDGALSGATLTILYPGGSGSGEATELTGTTQSSSATSAGRLTAALTASKARVASGKTLRVGIRTRNGSSSSAAKVVSCIKVPSNFAIVSAKGAKRSGRTLCFSVGTLAAGKSATRTITVGAVSSRTVKRFFTGTTKATGIAQSKATRKAVTITAAPADPRVTG